MILHLYLGLTKIQIEVKERKFQFIWKESIYHEILDFELDLLIHFCGHTNNKSFFTIYCFSNSRNFR